MLYRMTVSNPQALLSVKYIGFQREFPLGVLSLSSPPILLECFAERRQPMDPIKVLGHSKGLFITSPMSVHSIGDSKVMFE